MSSLSSMIPIAHAGHWIESVIVLVPTVGFILWLGIMTLRDRHAARDGETRERE